MQRGGLALDVPDLLINGQRFLIERQRPVQIPPRHLQIGDLVEQAAADLLHFFSALNSFCFR